MVAVMGKRDELFRKFGPLQIEAICRLFKDEINILRSLHGLPPRTDEQFYDQITNHYGDLEPYDWMQGD